MGSQVFYRKWRPQTLAEVVGQEHVTQTLRHALERGKVAHAYLFCGPRGTGKTSIGRILAKAVNCLENGRGEPCNSCDMCLAITEGRALDVIEVDAASNRGIDEIRDLRERVNYAPSSARYKVYIVDEVHMLTEPASNALLKTLEEPPPYIIFVLATTEPHKVLPTIMSRCQRFDFRRLPQAAVVSRLERICHLEDIAVEPEALRLITKMASGSLRDAENILEQLATYYGREIELNQVRNLLGLSGDLRAKELARHIVMGDVSAGLAIINRVASDGVDLRQFHRELVEYLRELLLVKAGSPEAVELTPEELEELRQLAAQAPLKKIAEAVRRFSGLDLRLDASSTLPLELALVECAAPEETTAAPPETEAIAQPAPAPEEPAQGEMVEAAVAPASPDLEYIRSRWREVIEGLRGAGSRGNLDALLRSACEPVAVEGNTLVLGFYYQFHKEKIEDPKYTHLVETKISQVLGTPYKISCVLTPKGKKAPNQSAVKGHLVRAAQEMGARIINVEEL
ncbi:MAG TPA: DNA polymerase III subunit gamma/tau [Dehalococcoidia bacterium]|nr:DNA polymerase III subunit gamma/tau [Dehalococcoidia bacterium]